MVSGSRGLGDFFACTCNSSQCDSFAFCMCFGNGPCRVTLRRECRNGHGTGNSCVDSVMS